MDYKKLYSDTAHSIKASAIRELLKVTARPEIISFAGGLPDSNLFPEKEIAEGGGLGSLRSKVESSGGEMLTEISPRYKLKVSVNKERGGRIPWQEHL